MPTLPLTLPSVLFTGSAGAVSDVVPGVYDCALGGRGYMVDWDKQTYAFTTSPLLRGQSDQGSQTGDQSINPEGLWRRTVEDWHHGMGQDNLDRGEYNVARFNTSKGVDCWSDSQLSLLNDTTESLTSTATNLNLVVAGTRMYVADNQTPKYTTDPFAVSPSYTSVTGIAAAAITAMASDGYQVFIAQGASGIYITDTSGSTASSWITGTVNDVAHVKGRVMASDSNDLYEITTAYSGGPVALPTALMSHSNTDFAWVGFAEGLNHIYAAGFSGDKSEVWRISILADGTALTAPTIAARLPDGEIVSSIYGYLGFVLVGTSKGFRLAIADDDGNLTLGALIETDTTIRSWEGQDRFVWFTWETFDTTSSGLGRVDLSAITDTNKLTPAYASDLMVTSQANINSVVTHSDKRVFSVSGDGVYAEDTDLVASGTLDSGWITYGLAEKKAAVSITSTLEFDGGTLTASMRTVEGASFDALGSTVTASKSTFDAKETAATRHELRWTLDRDGTDATLGPHVLAMTLKAHPQVAATQFITVPLLLRSTVWGHNDVPQTVDVVLERNHIESLWATRAITTFQEGSRSHTGVIEDFAYEAEDPDVGYGETQGVMTVKMKILEGAT